MNLSTRKAQIVEFDRQLRHLISQSPDKETKRDLNVALVNFRNRYCQTLDEKKACIMALIVSGAATLTELHDESRYRKETIIRIIKELLAEKKIKAVIYPISGPGRATKKYFPI